MKGCEIKDVYLDFMCSEDFVKEHCASIPNYKLLLAENGMPDLPDLWGMGTFNRAIESLESTLYKLLEKSVAEIARVKSTFIICATNTSETGIFLSECNSAISKLTGNIPASIFYTAATGCTNIFDALELGEGLLCKENQDVYIIAADFGSQYKSRLSNFALFSDYCCVLKMSRSSSLPFKVRKISNISNLNDTKDDNIEAFDEINKINFELVGQAVDASEIAAVYPMNNYIPITQMKYKKLGLSDKKVYKKSIKDRGHCGGADPFMSLIEDSKDYPPGSIFLLNAQSAGKSSMLIVSSVN